MTALASSVLATIDPTMSADNAMMGLMSTSIRVGRSPGRSGQTKPGQRNLHCGFYNRTGAAASLDQ
jgi:hypothetical protein